MMTAEGQLAWCNGTFLPADALAVPYFDLGVVAGASVTEMARTYGHRPFRLERHVRRLTESLKSLGFPCEYQSNDWIDAAASIVEHNAKQTSPRDELGIVMFATAGTNPTYLGGKGSVGTAAIHTFRLPFDLWRTSLSSGARLSIPSLRQISSQSLPVDHKIRNRLHWWLADRQATDIEPGSRALLLNAQNMVTETSTSAFHVVINGEIVTSDRDVLASLSSEVAEELATTLGIPFRRRALNAEELQNATEAFLSSTPTGLIPVCSINRIPVGSTCPGPVFTALHAAWSSRIGVPIPSESE